MANRVTVTIRGHIYPILAEEDEQYILQCADLVRRELDRAMEGTTLSLDDGAMLAGMNLADLYYKERQVSDNLRAQLKEALDENARLHRQNSQRKQNRSGGKQAKVRTPESPAAPEKVPFEDPGPDQTRLPIPQEKGK